MQVLLFTCAAGSLDAGSLMASHNMAHRQSGSPGYWRIRLAVSIHVTASSLRGVGVGRRRCYLSRSTRLA